MSHRASISCGLLLASLLVTPAGLAAGRTPSGRISVAQVMAWLESASSDAAANERLVLYVSGVVESALAASSTVQKRGDAALLCPPASGKGKMDGAQIATWLRAAEPDAKRWPETEATPIVLAQFLRAYPCSAR